MAWKTAISSGFRRLLGLIGAWRFQNRRFILLTRFLTSKTRSGSSLRGVNNRVTNTAEARRVFKELCIQIRAQLDRIHQKE